MLHVQNNVKSDYHTLEHSTDVSPIRVYAGVVYGTNDILLSSGTELRFLVFLPIHS